MEKRRKSKVLLTCAMAFVAAISCSLGVSASQNIDSVTASAETSGSVNYNAFLGLEDRTSWASGGHADIVTLGLMDFSITDGAQYFKSNVSGCWYHGNDAVVTANNGVDILQYIYIDGVSARDLITENATNNQTTANTTTWLSNPAAWPIAFETGTDCWIRIDKTKFGGDFTFTFKEGFSLIRGDGQVISISNDISYTYANGVLGQKVEHMKYTLSFEGFEETKTVKGGEAIGKLPAVPAKDGYVGLWMVDGKRIDENSTISANATAKPAYALEYQDMIAIEDRAWGAAPDEYYFGGYSIGLPTDENAHWLNTADSINGPWHNDNRDVIVANNGVDILQYIYVNGKSARDAITENRASASPMLGTSGWLTNPAASPVFVETTNGSALIIKILKAYSGESFTLTFKAGFSLIRNDGQLIYISNDVTYKYENGTLTDISRVYVTFDGENAQLVGIGRNAVAPATNPTKEANESHTYTFDGWYDGETKWNFDSPVQGQMNLVSKFIETEKAKYSVTFNADNGTESTNVSVYDSSYVKEDQIPANPEKATDGNTAYTFVCWSADGENAYDFTTPVTQDITLTAIYTTKPVYTVTMGDDTVKVVEGGKVEKPTDPTQESTAEFDYIFDGWYNGETKWDFENDTVSGNLTLTAKFTANKRSYTITFNVTGNEAVVLAPATVEYGTTYDLATLLDGVDVSAYKYTITVNGEEVTSVEVLADVTVDVAFVARVYYTVSIDGVEQTVEEGEKAVMPETEPTKASTAEFSYTFDGWYNGETKWDFENDVVNANVELVAKFIESKRIYTVTFVVTGNDEITLDPVQVEYGTTFDLTNLLEGKDVSGYTYSITVGEVEKISFKVVADTTVTVAFTKKAEEPKDNASGGCKGSVSGAMGAMLTAAALGLVALTKKKED